MEEQAWDNWLVGSDSDSSDSSDWINVESDGPDELEISDSDSGMGDSGPSFARSDQQKQSPVRVSSLATTKVRTSSIPCEAWADIPLRYLRQPILL